MVETDAPGGEFFSIVVIGTMNPAIHQPRWYQFVGLLDESEAEGAAALGLVVMPQIARFSAAGFTVLCLPDRWEIQTASRDLLERVLAIACRVFEILTHTPASQYGFNFHFPVGGGGTAGAAQRFMQALKQVPPAFQPSVEDAKLGEVIVGLSAGLTSRQVAVSSVSGADRLLVRVNSTYQVAAAPGEIHFELTPRLQEHFFPDYDLAREKAAAIAAALGTV